MQPTRQHVGDRSREHATMRSALRACCSNLRWTVLGVSSEPISAGERPVGDNQRNTRSASGDLMLLQHRVQPFAALAGLRRDQAVLVNPPPCPRTGMPASARHPLRRIPLFHTDAAQESLDSPIDRRSAYYRAARQASAEIPPPPQPLLTPPNILTLLRVFLVPVFVFGWYSTAFYAPIATAAVFVGAALTDAIDGYLARKLEMSTAFGAFLDPVADKLMVSTALILLATAPPAPIPSAAMAVPVLVIIGREIAMSSLREWAAASDGNAHKATAVNSIGKFKTAAQMVGISALLVLRESHRLLGSSPARLELIHTATWVSLAMLYGGAFLGLLSLYTYLRGVWPYFRYPGGPPAPPAAVKAPKEAAAGNGDNAFGETAPDGKPTKQS